MYVSAAQANSQKWLSSNGHVVRFFNGTFYHQEKQQRFSETKDFSIAPNFNLTLLQSRQYQRSVSLARLRSHADAAAEFNKWIWTNSEKPDVIFCAYPVEELCRAAARFGRINNIPVVMDCRDFWPDIFAERLPGPLQLAAPFIFGTFERDARNTLGAATALSGHTRNQRSSGVSTKLAAPGASWTFISRLLIRPSLWPRAHWQTRKSEFALRGRCHDGLISGTGCEPSASSRTLCNKT